MSITYKDAGVDKHAGYEEVRLIKDLVKKTYTKGVLSEIGGFAGLFELDTAGYERPVLVSGTDGVGTKLKLAFMMDRHDTIGEDCVAMCVNDIICQGAKPLFFLDYIASSKLEPVKMAKIVEGIANGCQKAGCALIGGETAEMPGLYAEGEYDVAGFVVGVADKHKLIDGSAIRKGDVLLGLPSSGVHSNGFSLIRKIVFEKCGFKPDRYIEELGTTIGEELLKPTSIYAAPVLSVMRKVTFKGISHITGGGFYENIPRMLPEGLSARINVNSFEVPKIFRLLQSWAEIPEEEMFGTFNMGIGMVLAISPEEAEKAVEEFRREGVDCRVLGETIPGDREVSL